MTGKPVIYLQDFQVHVVRHNVVLGGRTYSRQYVSNIQVTTLKKDRKSADRSSFVKGGSLFIVVCSVFYLLLQQGWSGLISGFMVGFVLSKFWEGLMGLTEPQQAALAFNLNDQPYVVTGRADRIKTLAAQMKAPVRSTEPVHPEEVDLSAILQQLGRPQQAEKRPATRSKTQETTPSRIAVQPAPPVSPVPEVHQSLNSSLGEAKAQSSEIALRVESLTSKAQENIHLPVEPHCTYRLHLIQAGETRVYGQPLTFSGEGEAQLAKKALECATLAMVDLESFPTPGNPFNAFAIASWLQNAHVQAAFPGETAASAFLKEFEHPGSMSYSLGEPILPRMAPPSRPVNPNIHWSYQLWLNEPAAGREVLNAQILTFHNEDEAHRARDALEAVTGQPVTMTRSSQAGLLFQPEMVAKWLDPQAASSSRPWYGKVFVEEFHAPGQLKRQRESHLAVQGTSKQPKRQGTRAAPPAPAPVVLPAVPAKPAVKPSIVISQSFQLTYTLVIRLPDRDLFVLEGKALKFENKQQTDAVREALETVTGCRVFLNRPTVSGVPFDPRDLAHWLSVSGLRSQDYSQIDQAFLLEYATSGKPKAEQCPAPPSPTLVTPAVRTDEPPSTTFTLQVHWVGKTKPVLAGTPLTFDDQQEAELVKGALERVTGQPVFLNSTTLPGLAFKPTTLAVWLSSSGLPAKDPKCSLGEAFMREYENPSQPQQARAITRQPQAGASNPKPAIPAVHPPKLVESCAFDALLFDCDNTLAFTHSLQEFRDTHQFNSALWQEALGRLQPSKDVLRVLQVLQQRYPQLILGVYSRAPQQYVEAVLTQVLPGIQFDLLLTYEDAKRVGNAWKPHPGVVQYFLKQRQLQAARVALFGDDDGDVEAAHTSGAQGVLCRFFERHKRNANDWSTERGLQALPQAVVTHPDDILEFVKNPAVFDLPLEALTQQIPAANLQRRIEDLTYLPNEGKGVINKFKLPVLCLGRYYKAVSHGDNQLFLLPSSEGHITTQQILAKEKGSQAVPPSWVEATAWAIRQHLMRSTGLLVITIIPSKSGRPARLEKLLKLLRQEISEERVLFDPDVFQFTGHAVSNKALNQAERRVNVQGHLHLHREFCLTGGEYVIIDDVVTTGETLLRARDLLRQQGVQRVKAIAISKTLSVRKKVRGIVA